MELNNFVVINKRNKEKLDNQIGLLLDDGYPKNYIDEAVEMRKTICPDCSLKEIVSMWDKPDTRVQTFKSCNDFEQSHDIRIA